LIITAQPQATAAGGSTAVSATTQSLTATVQLILPDDGNFENGLNGWQVNGSVSLSTNAVQGLHSLQLGTKETIGFGLSSVSQTFLMPLTVTTISLRYRGFCQGTIQTAGAQFTLTDLATGDVLNLLQKVCQGSSLWYTLAVSISAFRGRMVTLTLANMDDNVSGNSNNSTTINQMNSVEFDPINTQLIESGSYSLVDAIMID